MGDALNRIRQRVGKSPSNLTSIELGDSGDAIHVAWCDPQPLPSAPPVLPFPLDTIPKVMADYYREAALALNVPVDYVAVPGLTLAGAAVGRARATSLKDDYCEYACLWSVVIAPPGATKSSALNMARAPMNFAEAKWLDEHRRSMSIFDVEMDRYNIAVKEWRKDGVGEPPQKPVRPTLRQAFLDNFTAESAARVLNENPRGIVVIKDELIGFVRSMGQYKGGKGDDKQFFLSAWAGQLGKVSRSKDHESGPLYIPNPFVAITGMMVPDSLPELRGENFKGVSQSDGFIDRFLFSFPDPIPAVPEQWITVPESSKLAYTEVFSGLMAMDMTVMENEPGLQRYRPWFVNLNSEARAVWDQFTAEIAAKINSFHAYDPYRGVLSKLKGYCLHYAAILWALRRASGELPHDCPLDGETLFNAAMLIDYHESHARRCLGVGYADRKHRVAKRLIEWLERESDRTAFSRRDAFQQLKDRRDVTDSKSLTDVFDLLTDFGYIRPIDPTGRPGPATEVFLVNPKWTRN